MPIKKNTTIAFVLFTTATRFLFAPIQTESAEDKPLCKIYKKSLAAIKNIVDVRSELKDEIDTIEAQRSDLEKRKNVLRTTAKEIERIFPRTGVDVDARAQEMIQHLRTFENKPLDVQGIHEENGTKSNKAIALGIISGVLLSSVVGIVLWKGARRRPQTDRRDGIFIDTITRYLERHR